MSYQNLMVEADHSLQIITIDRADKMNNLDQPTMKELKEAIQKLNQDDELQGAIITGAGEKAFAAGADISEFADYDASQGKEMSQKGHETMNTIEQSAKPVIAAVNGFALGGGCELAMACHLRVAVEKAKLGQPEVGLGIIPGYGGTQRLVQLIGKGKALELLMTGTPISAERAESLGLVNRVCASDELLPKAKELLNSILSNGPVALQKVIDCVNTHFEEGENGFQKEIQQFSECFDTEDFKEGTQAFLNKRKPEFQGK